MASTKTELQQIAQRSLDLNPNILGENGCVCYAWKLSVPGGANATIIGYAPSIVEAEADIADYQARHQWARKYPQHCSAPSFADNRDSEYSYHQEYSMAAILEGGC